MTSKRTKPTPTYPKGTMRCPDCENGWELNRHGQILRVDVVHRVDDCPDPDLHFEGYDRDLCCNVQRHAIRCQRCGGEGRVAAPEALLAQMLATLRSISATGKNY